MKIVVFTHPLFLKSNSMPKFADMLCSGYESLGLEVIRITPPPFFYRLSSLLAPLSKWLGYIDQYILFPFIAKIKISKINKKNTIFVFCDQALGPWVPLVVNYPHVIHVHDLLALKSSLGLEPINKTNITGRIYQNFIRSGFENAKFFISISNKTKHDLHKYSNVKPIISEIVLNGLNYSFKKLSKGEVEGQFLNNKINLKYKQYLLNVGANQWYKNRLGLLYLYKLHLQHSNNSIPLVIVGPEPNKTEKKLIKSFGYTNKVVFYNNIDEKTLNTLYSGAICLLQPSHEEGFGWPIIEAQASGTCVITTDSNPMNEIAGEHSVLFSPTEQYRNGNIEEWAKENLDVLIHFLEMNNNQRNLLESKSLVWSTNFSQEKTLQKYLKIYQHCVAQSNKEI